MHFAAGFIVTAFAITAEVSQFWSINRLATPGYAAYQGEFARRAVDRGRRGGAGGDRKAWIAARALGMAAGRVS